MHNDHIFIGTEGRRLSVLCTDCNWGSLQVKILLILHLEFQENCHSTKQERQSYSPVGQGHKMLSKELHQRKILSFTLRCGTGWGGGICKTEKRKGNSCLARPGDTNPLGGHHPNHSPLPPWGRWQRRKISSGLGPCSVPLRYFLYGVSVPLPQGCPLGAPRVAEMLKGVFLLFWGWGGGSPSVFHPWVRLVLSLVLFAGSFHQIPDASVLPFIPEMT